ncbi:MAG: hypothetical protein IT372_26230 [Polyangiaceae bacterium]|nr:hypothetical protein [Polyangiaceae bacterium]
MYVSVRASRVVVGGLDVLAALAVLMWGILGVPLAAGVIRWWLGWGEAAGVLVGLLAHAAVAAGCRYRLVVDGRGSRLWRTCLGVPWSRRPLGLRPRVVADVGWDWDELCIVPEHPRDGEDRFVVMETPPGGWTWEDLQASADAADREIARVAAQCDRGRLACYRSPAQRDP